MYILAFGQISVRDGAATKSRKRRCRSPELQQLTGWQQVSAFLQQPISVIKRWTNEGMPVTKHGRFVSAKSDDLIRWLEQEVRGL
jgi:hypothetical protein